MFPFWHQQRLTATYFSLELIPLAVLTENVRVLAADSAENVCGGMFDAGTAENVCVGVFGSGTAENVCGCI